MGLFDFFKKKPVTEAKASKTATFIKAEDIQALPETEYWKLVDERGTEILDSINKNYTNSSKAAIDSLFSAASVLAVKTNMPMPSLLQALLNNYMGVVSASGQLTADDVMGTLASHLPKVTDKSQLN